MKWAKDLFPFCRSLTGEGNRKTLNYIKNINKNFKIKSFNSGEKVFDWQIPQEWKINDAYIKDNHGKKIVDLEIKYFGITLSDSSLKDIIINDKTFFKDEKFSRTEYEKFLLKNGLNAPGFEQNISEQEKKRQLLSFLSEGMRIPNFLVQNAFKKENQIKDIKYIDLKNYYESKKIEEKEINKTYNENKNLFEEKYRSISFLELDPEILIGQKEYSKNYFDTLLLFL